MNESTNEPNRKVTHIPFYKIDLKFKSSITFGVTYRLNLVWHSVRERTDLEFRTLITSVKGQGF